MGKHESAEVLRRYAKGLHDIAARAVRCYVRDEQLLHDEAKSLRDRARSLMDSLMVHVDGLRADHLERHMEEIAAAGGFFADDIAEHVADFRKELQRFRVLSGNMTCEQAIRTFAEAQIDLWWTAVELNTYRNVTKPVPEAATEQDSDETVVPKGPQVDHAVLEDIQARRRSAVKQKMDTLKIIRTYRPNYKVIEPRSEAAKELDAAALEAIKERRRAMAERMAGFGGKPRTNFKDLEPHNL